LYYDSALKATSIEVNTLSIDTGSVVKDCTLFDFLGEVTTEVDLLTINVAASTLGVGATGENHILFNFDGKLDTAKLKV
jgi:hypothetical protein